MTKTCILLCINFFVVSYSVAEGCIGYDNHHGLISEKEFNVVENIIIDSEYGMFVSLLECGLNVNSVADTRAGSNFLTVAIKNNNINFLKFMLDEGFHIDKRDGNYNTPLLFAIKEGNKNAITTLVDRGADVTVKNKYNELAVDLARDKGIDLLLKGSR